MGQVKWMLEATLRRYAKNSHALVQASGLAKTTVYSIVNGETTSVDLKTLEKLLLGLEQLTGEPMNIEDILKREPSADLSPALLAQLTKAQPFDWDEVQKLIPEWTDEERAENERFWQEHRGEKRAALARDEQRLERIADVLDGPAGHSRNSSPANGST